MCLPIHGVTMYLRMKSPTDLSCGTAEGDPISATRRMIDSQAFRFQVRPDLADIARTQTEPIGVLFRRQPLVVVRRGAILLLSEQFLQRRLLASRWSQHE